MYDFSGIPVDDEVIRTQPWSEKPFDPYEQLSKPTAPTAPGKTTGPFMRGTPDAPWSNQNAAFDQALGKYGTPPKTPLPSAPLLPGQINGAIQGYKAPMPGVTPGQIPTPVVNGPNQHNQWGRAISALVPFGLGPLIQSLFNRKN